MGKIEEFTKKLLEAKTVALDSMIFIYLLEKNQQYFPLIESIFDLLEKKKITGITSIISPLEVLSTPRLNDDAERIDLYLRFFQEETNLLVSPIEWNIIKESASLRRNFKIRSPDAIQLATAKINQAKLFISNDDIFKKIININELPEIVLLSSF